MSSILQALKKIEVISTRSETFFTMPQTSDTTQANNSKARRRWFVPSLLVFFLVLLVIVVAAIIIFNRRKPIIAKNFPAEVIEKQKENPASPSEKSNIFRSKIPLDPKNPTESPSQNSPLAKSQMKPTQAPGNDKNKAANGPSQQPYVTIDQQRSEPTPAVRSPQPGRAATRKKTLQREPASKDTVASKKTIAAKSVPSGKPATAAKSVPSGKPATKAKKPDTSRKYDRIDDAKLKLQALAWFSDASKRMAVINSHIVREGGSVDGYQVTQIRRQDVVVNDGRKSWRLVFGLKQ